MRHGLTIFIDPETKAQSKINSGNILGLRLSKRSSELHLLAMWWPLSSLTVRECMIDFLKKGQTIIGAYCASVLRQLKQTIKTKRRRKLRSCILLLQVNSPVHTLQVTMTEAERCSFELLSRVYYSPDLARLTFTFSLNLNSTCMVVAFKVMMTSLMLFQSI